jgi:hypothetical protein
MVIDLLRRFFVLDFSFILPGIKRKKGELLKDVNEKEIRNISILKEQLIAIGYNPGEVDYMIETSTKGLDITKLDSNQLKDIEKALTAQLSIARQCLDFIRNPK